MKDLSGKPVRVFVVWEPVLPTDWGAPSTATLKRIADSRATQFWDKRRLISHSLGEHNRRSVIWDYIAVYPAGVIWTDRPPRSLYAGGPVVRVEEPARGALVQALDQISVAHEFQK
ncbi:MAG: hypothetical protein WB676_02085 [Bryobacteraceae bacterium]